MYLFVVDGINKRLTAESQEWKAERERLIVAEVSGRESEKI
jgi:hypothetical protein